MGVWRLMGTCMTHNCVGNRYKNSMWCLSCNVANAVLNSDPPEDRGD